MPIRFRCSYCNRLLGIATRKAGTQTTCPHCGNSITVPIPNEDAAQTERVNLEDVDELLGKTAAMTADSAVAAPPAPPTPLATSPPPAPEPSQEVINPEFEEPLSLPPPPPPPPPKRKPTPAKQPVAKQNPAPPPPPAKARTSPPPAPKPAAKPTNPEDRPLFEGDVDEILGATALPEEEEKVKPPVTSGLDAMSLGEPARQITLSSQVATLLVAAVVVLTALAFTAGYFLAPRH